MPDGISGGVLSEQDVCDTYAYRARKAKRGDSVRDLKVKKRVDDEEAPGKRNGITF